MKGPICTYEFSGGLATNHSDVIGLVATTIAHEMGHNFGMEHDTDELCECPDKKCIMSPSSTSVTPIHWSSCSLNSLALAFERGMDYCLRYVFIGNRLRYLFESNFKKYDTDCCSIVPIFVKNYFTRYFFKYEPAKETVLPDEKHE